MKKLILFLITGLVFNLQSQVITIDSARHLDTGTVCTVRAVITTQREFTLGIVYFQDPTAGLAAFNIPFCNAVNRGDSVEITGKLKNFNGLLEFDPVNSFTKLDSNKAVTPVVVTPTLINTNGEFYESKLIRINGVTSIRTTSGQPVTIWGTASTNYRLCTAVDTCEIRIYSTTNIAGSPVPPYPFDVISISSQFNSTYQVLPRSLSDFISQNPGPLLSQISYSNILPTSVTINWQTSTSADSKVRWQAADSNYQLIVFTDSVYNASMVTTHTITLNGLQPGRIYYYNVSSTNPSGTSTSQQLYFCTQSNSTGTMNVYFNRSVDTTINSGELAQGNVNFQPKLLSRINSAQHSIDMALYSLDDFTQIRDALINAKLRGVKIRFVYDYRETGVNQPLVNELLAAGFLMMKRPSSSGLMHNKFFVFDYRNNTSHNDCWVWTGSTNITNRQFYDDANNVIEIQDRTLAAVYTREFEEMWGSATDIPIASRSKFGSQKSNNVPHVLNINNTRVDIYFSPGDNGTSQIQNLINTNFDYDCYFSILSFTDFNIANRMKARYLPGVRFVKGVFDRDTAGGVFREMIGYGPFAWNPPADVVRDVNEPYDLHHKYMIIDPLNISSNPAVETGSYNYSNSANNTNDENFLIVYSPRIANLYVQEWYKRYRISGGTAVIGIEQISSEIPERFELGQNYPNPFNPATTIIYNLPKSSMVTLKIYDVTGKQVQVLVNEQQSAGTYKAKMTALNMASGVYFYMLEADGVKIDTKKMILVK